jgi:hypothetical protein
MLLIAGRLAFAGTPVVPVTHLVSPPILYGKFTQEKTIVGLKKPLISHGDFLVVRDKGVVWRTQKPFASAVSVTRKGIWSLNPTGQAIKRAPIHQGNLGVAMDMIQKVLAGDPASLSRIFSVAETGDAQKWAMDLKPLDPVVAKVINSIHLQGGKQVDQVDYLEANGDRTRIDFTDVVPDAGDLGPWQSVALGD